MRYKELEVTDEYELPENAHAKLIHVYRSPHNGNLNALVGLYGEVGLEISRIISFVTGKDGISTETNGAFDLLRKDRWEYYGSNPSSVDALMVPMTDDNQYAMIAVDWKRKEIKLIKEE